MCLLNVFIDLRGVDIKWYFCDRTENRTFNTGLSQLSCEQNVKLS